MYVCNHKGSNKHKENNMINDVGAEKLKEKTR
jgi:hypothetical protein